MEKWQKLVDSTDVVFELPKVSDNFKKMFVRDEKNPKAFKGGVKRSLIVTAMATHAARMTRNDTFYLPEHVKGAVGSWVKDYPKPIQIDHSHGARDTVGRVISARYVDLSATASVAGMEKDSYKLLTDSKKEAKSFKLAMEALTSVNNIVKIQRSGVDWGGLGYDEVVMEITEPDAIDRFLRDEYMTFSSGKTAGTVYCSICGQDFFKDGMCEHNRGEEYEIKDKDDKVIGKQYCVWIAGPLSNDELTITSFPANEKSTKVSQEMKEATTDFYIYEEDASILNHMNDLGKNLLAGGITLNDALIPDAEEEEKTKAIFLKEHKELVEDVKAINYVTDKQEGHMHRAVIDPAMGNGHTDYPLNHSHSIVGKAIEDAGPVQDWNGERDANGNYPTLVKRHTHKLDKEVEPLDSVEYVDAVEEITMENINAHIIKLAEEMDGDDEDYSGECSEDCEDEEVDIGDAAKKKKNTKPGGSNAGKYKTKGPFCGPSGGAPKGSYPVNTLKRAKAALSLARHAPNPAGIKSCVCRHWPSLGSCKKKKKDEIEDTILDTYPDWPIEFQILVTDRIRAATDEAEHALIYEEAEEDLYIDQIGALKYDDDIKPILDNLINDVKTTKKLDGKELQEEDITLIIEGIKKSILATSARERLSKKHCIMSRELPVLDKWHAMALRTLMESNDFSVSTKAKMLYEVARLEKAMGYLKPQENDKEEPKPKEIKCFKDIYEMLDEKGRKMIDDHIKAVSVVEVDKKQYIGIDKHNEDVKGIQDQLDAANTDLEDTKTKAERYVKENRAFTKRLSQKQSEFLVLLVENIIDLKTVDGDSFDADKYAQELLEREENSLKDKVKDLRERVRREFGRKPQGGNVGNDGNDGEPTLNQRLSEIPPGRLRYFNEVKLKLDKTNKDNN